jgi:hypothetical protein
MLVDGTYKQPPPPKKKRQKTNPVSKLSKALKEYKNERINTENVLIDRIKKVNLDKTILFREKQ